MKEREMLGYKKRVPRLDVGQKLHAIFKAVKEVAKWTLGEFLYHIFKLKNEDGTKFSRSSTHAATVSQFLEGQTIYGPSDILDAWFRNPDGRVSTEPNASKLMYSTDKPFCEIGPVHVALSAFAVQIVRDRVVQEAEITVKPANGLHVSFRTKSDTQQTEWANSRLGAYMRINRGL